MPPKKKSLKRGAASEETTTAIATEEQTVESHKKPKVAKKSGTIKLDGFKEFSANAAKQLKAHCGAGRVEAARVALQKHGYEAEGCVQASDEARKSANIELLLDCAQNAARMGHEADQCAIIDMLLDLGITPNFTFMYWVAKSCRLDTLVRCAAICVNNSVQNLPDGDPVLNDVVSHALEFKIAGNFLHLIETSKAQIPVCLPSINGFVNVAQPDGCVYQDVNSGESDRGELRDRVRGAILKCWADAGSIPDAVTECKRLQAISEEYNPGSGGRYDIAIEMLESYKI